MLYVSGHVRLPVANSVAFRLGNLTFLNFYVGSNLRPNTKTTALISIQSLILNSPTTN